MGLFFLLIFSQTLNAAGIRDLDTTARTHALAGTSDLTSFEGESLNPASLAFNERMALSVTSIQGLAQTKGSKIHFAGVKSPMVYSVGYFLYDYGAIETVDELGLTEGKLEPQDENVSFNIAGPMGQENLSWGLRVSRFQSTLDIKAKAYQLDFGLVQKNWLANRIDFGVSYLGWSKRLDWQTSSEKPRGKVSLQTVYKGPARIYLSTTKQNSKWEYALAAEVPWQFLLLRWGWFNSKYATSRAQYRWGVGLMMGNLKLDWGSAFMDALGDTNFATLSYLF